MPTTNEVLEKISDDLLKGYAEIAVLGDSPRTELRLDSPEKLARYLEIVRPNIWK